MTERFFRAAFAVTYFVSIFAMVFGIFEQKNETVLTGITVACVALMGFLVFGGTDHD